ncbi:MAG: DUF2961 domain-containing protein [Candidatus Paceibacterota bacterium]
MTKVYKIFLAAAIILVSGPNISYAMEAYGLAGMSQFERLPYLRLDTLAGADSSYDRTGANQDHDKWLYTENGEQVILDLKGPGQLDRMWFTGLTGENTPARLLGNLVGTVKIYLDGETVPRKNMPLNTMFLGSTLPFISPLTGNYAISSSGNYNYLPITFNNSIKITLTGTKTPTFYNFNYHMFPVNASVATWTGNEDSSSVKSIWTNASNDPKSDAGNVLVSGTADMPANTSQTLLDIAGPRSISSIKIKIPSLTKDILNNVYLKISWDNEASPSINAPIGAFFAMGNSNPYPTRALPVGKDAAEFMYSYFPMPFRSNAKIELVSQHPSALNGIAYEIKHKPFAGNFSEVGYLKTQYNHGSHAANDGTDFNIIDAEGSGNFVGVMQSIKGPIIINSDGTVGSYPFMEGDERIYVDGSQSPIAQGTGIEDFYNGGFFYVTSRMGDKVTNFSLPTHGATANTGLYSSTAAAGSLSMNSQYRFFISDLIPFRKHIKIGVEHGSGNNRAVEEWTLAYYYFKPDASMVLTDTIDIGTSASETSHGYAITNQASLGTLNSFYPGEKYKTAVSDAGRTHTGTSQFNASINSVNSGVILRRSLDYSVLNQQAEVYVDNTLVGIWYTAGSNATLKWKDSDYLIPSSFTNGKSQIQVKIKWISGASWTEYKYQVFSTNFVESNPVLPPTDSAAPSIAITSPANNETYYNAVASVSGTASDDIAVNKVEVKVGAGAWQLASGTTSWTISNLALVSGSNVITARAADTATPQKTAETSITIIYTPTVVDPGLPTNEPGKIWNRTFNDDFDGTAIDQTKWRGGYEKALWCGDPNGTCPSQFTGVTVSGGTLKLQPKQGSTTWDYQNRAMIHTGGIPGATNLGDRPKFSQRFGYFEAKIKFPTNASGEGNGYWLSYWALPVGKTCAGGRCSAANTDNGINQFEEVDILEHWYPATGLTRTKLNFHDLTFNQKRTDGITAIGFNYPTTTVGNLSADFHRYGLYWRDDGTGALLPDGTHQGSMQVYFDGVPQGTPWPVRSLNYWQDGIAPILQVIPCTSSDPATCRTSTVSNPLIFDYVKVYKEISDIPAAKTKIMPLGDSITAWDYSYRVKLFNSLTAAGWNFDFVGSTTTTAQNILQPSIRVPDQALDSNHEGWGGKTISELSTTFDSTLAWITADPVQRKPDIITLHIGTNNIFRPSRVAEAPADLGVLIDKIKTNLPDTKVYVASIIPMGTQYDPGSSLVNAYNAAIKTIVQGKGGNVYFVDMNAEAGINTATDLEGGSIIGLHPTHSGSDKMADVWLSHLNLSYVPVLTSIAVSPINVSIPINGTQVFSAVSKDQNGNSMTGVNISWTSSNNTVVSVDSTGMATALSLGTATITASSGAKSGTASVAVTLAQTNLILNFSFESGTSPWTFYTNGTGTFTSSPPASTGLKAAKIFLSTLGTNMQLYQSGISLEPNTSYRLTFSAYSSTGHDFKVNLFKDISPYTNYGLASYTPNLTSSWQVFTKDFTTSGFSGNVSDTRFQVYFPGLASAGDIYYLDDLKLEKVISSPADLNSDSIVNSVDFGIMMSFWTYTNKPKADLNQDGFVNSQDLGMLMSKWG